MPILIKIQEEEKQNMILRKFTQRMKGCDSNTDLSSVASELNNAMSIESLQRVPTKIRIQVSRSPTKTDQSSGPPVRINSRGKDSRNRSSIAQHSSMLSASNQSDNLKAMIQIQGISDQGSPTSPSKSRPLNFPSPRQTADQQLTFRPKASAAVDKKKGGTTDIHRLSEVTESTPKQQHKSILSRESSVRASRVSKLQQLLLEPEMFNGDYLKKKREMNQTPNNEMSSISQMKGESTLTTLEGKERGREMGRFSQFKIQEQQTKQDAADLDQDETISLWQDSNFVLMPKHDQQKWTRNKRAARYNSQQLSPRTQGGMLTERSMASKLSDQHKAPQASRIDLYSVQNSRLNELRDKIKSKLEARRSMQGSVMSRSSMMEQNDVSDVRKSAETKVKKVPPSKKSTRSLPPIISRDKAQKGVELPQDYLHYSKYKLLAELREEFNRPPKLVRPIGSVQVPVFSDHIGPCPPHSMNMTEAQKREFKKLGSSHKKAEMASLQISQSPRVPQVKISPTAKTSPRNDIIKKASTKYYSSFKNSKAKSSKKLRVALDDFGCREDATQEQQVKAIVTHFKNKIQDGTYLIMPGPPRQPEENQKVAVDSEKQLADSLVEYQGHLKDLMLQRDTQRSKKRNRIYLGSFNEKTIDLYQELEVCHNRLERLLSQQTEADSSASNGKGKKKQSFGEKPIDSQIKEVKQHMSKLLTLIKQQQPKMMSKLQGFQSVSQIFEEEFPVHLPDIQQETSKLIREESKKGKRRPRAESECESTAAEEKKSNLYKPYKNGQDVAFPEQVKIFNGRLEVFRYTIGPGLIHALSQRIQQETQLNNSIQELTLDQNNLSDESLAQILEAMFDQADRFNKACQSINISNNDFGSKSAEALTQLFTFKKPYNIENLRLGSLRLSDQVQTILLSTLSKSQFLSKLRLSDIPLTSKPALGSLMEFLQSNRSLKELDLSDTNLTIEAMTQIFSILPECPNLSTLNMSYNLNEYSRAPEQAREMMEAINCYLNNNQKLVHLDLSGLNLGSRVAELAESLASSKSLMAIHLDQNEIPAEVKDVLYDTLKIRRNLRLNRFEVQKSAEERKDEFVEAASVGHLLNKSATTAKTIEVDHQVEKLAELKRNQLRTECIQFQGVGRRRRVHDKLVLIRYLGHQEFNLFSEFNVLGWRVSSGDQCYVCEGWKYTVYFYDRRKSIKNKLVYGMSKGVMEYFNKNLGTDYKRRVQPTISSPTLIPYPGQAKMGNLLEYAARLNPRISAILEQTAVNAQKPENDMSQVIKLYLQKEVTVADIISLSLDLEINEQIMKSLRYPQDSEIINMPTNSNYFSREMEDDDTFVWAGFAKPGKHTVVISDPINPDGPFQETFLVEVRQNELIKHMEPMPEESQEIEMQGASRLDYAILFSSQKKDTQDMFDLCFNFDFEKIDISDLIKSQEELEECKIMLKSHYSEFLKIFAILSSHSENFPLIDEPRYEIFCHMLEIVSPSLNFDEIIELFRSIGNHRDISRPQFLKIIIYLIYLRYLRPQAQQQMQRVRKRLSSRTNVTTAIPVEYMIKDINTGVKHFFENKIAKFIGNRTWQEFRGRYVQRLKVSNIIIQYMTILRRIYSSWSFIVNSRRIFTKESACEMFALCRHLTKKIPLGKVLQITDEELLTCWGLSKLTVKDLDSDLNRTKHMVFIEFVEFICRVAFVAQFPEVDRNRVIKKRRYDREDDDDDFDQDKNPFATEQSEFNSDDDEEYFDQRGEIDYDDFEYTQQNAASLKNFKFLFDMSQFQFNDSKTFRKKLRWLLNLLPLVKSRAQQHMEQRMTLYSSGYSYKRS